MAFVLNHTVLGDPAAEQVCFVLHGVLGSGSNFRSLFKELAVACSHWRFVLADLRLHGRSLDAPPPHTLAACAKDLVVLGEHLGAAPTAVVGHSFGGKVALSYAALEPPALRQVWVLDSYPGAHDPHADHEVVRVIRALETAPASSPSREAFVDALTEQGLSLGIARWLSQNLVRERQHYRLRLDLGAIQSLLADYFERDLWPQLERPPAEQELHLVVAERSRRLGDAARQRLGELALRRRVFRHTLPNAGHWLHVDNPKGLLELLTPAFCLASS